MTPSIVPIYASLLGLIFIFLSIRVIRVRRQEKIAVGDGGNPRLCRAIAVHNNFAQYVPFALVLLAFVEMRGVPSVAVHALCLLLLVGRLLHAYGVSQARENFRFRIRGMQATFAVIGLSALFLLGSSLASAIEKTS